MNTHIETPKNGRSQPKPARLSSVTGAPSSRSRAATTRERAERHRAVRDQVVDERPRAELVGGGDRDQHEARVRDRRVGEQPLHVPLRERGDVADRERGRSRSPAIAHVQRCSSPGNAVSEHAVA